jgi:UMF1 family MFS transporter
MADAARRRAIDAWCLYDVGNSAFITTVVAAILPIYFSTVAGAGLDSDPERARVLATSRWGLLNGLSLLVVAIGSPILGALADLRGSRKRLLAMCAAVGAVVTSLLFFVQRGDWVLAAVLFGVAQVAFSWSIVMYDALLPQVAPATELDRVSSRGYAWGYLGGGLLLAVQVAAISKPAAFGLSNAGLATRLSFLSVGIWWLAFTVPLLRHVRELPAAAADDGPTPGVAAPRPDLQLARRTFGRLWHTLHELRRHREAFRFLLAFWLYNDGIGTIVRMATIFGAEVGVDRSTLIGGISRCSLAGWRGGSEPSGRSS